MTNSVTARGHANIALVKYWGKRDLDLNLPAVGSISVTLQNLFTDTQVCFLSALEADEIDLGDSNSREADLRVKQFLDRVRNLAGIKTYAQVKSINNFPTAVGLASSASGFAALCLAATKAANLNLSSDELSVLARLGSGSAPRSLLGGFVELRKGSKQDGSDCVAKALFSAEHWPLEILVAITSLNPKQIGSSAAMILSAQTSPFYSAWVEGSEVDLQAARLAIKTRDIELLAKISERNCLRMHAVAQASEPPVIFWQPATLQIIETVRRLRAQGWPVAFTIDAGPQVKIICEPNIVQKMQSALADIPGVVQIIKTALGPQAHILSSQA